MRPEPTEYGLDTQWLGFLLRSTLCQRISGLWCQVSHAHMTLILVICCWDAQCVLFNPSLKHDRQAPLITCRSATSYCDSENNLSHVDDQLVCSFLNVWPIFVTLWTVGWLWWPLLHTKALIICPVNHLTSDVVYMYLAETHTIMS